MKSRSFGSRPRVLGKETKDDAIEKPGDAEIFLLRDVHFFAGFGVGQFHAFAALQRLGDFGNLHRQIFGDLGGRALRFEKIRIGKKRAKDAKIFRAVNLVVGKFVNLLNRTVEIRFDDVAVKIANHEQRRIKQ